MRKTFVRRSFILYFARRMKKRLSTNMATTTVLPNAGPNVGVVTPQAGQIKRRRKLDFTESQRFKGKHFYLDLDGYKRAKDLAVELSSRGATIQKFMDKSVRYVITNKPQQLIDQAKSNKGSSNPTTPSTGGLSQILSPLSATSQSPHVDKKPSPQFNYFTRSRKILEMGMEKSPKNGFTDVLATASRWNIKIIHVNAVEKELKKLKPLSNKKEIQYKRPTPKYVRRLRQPFFKLEDKSRLYKPIIYEPIQWPCINMDCSPKASPFDVKYIEPKPVKEKSSENNDDDTDDDKCASTNTSTYSCKEEDVVYEEKRPGFCEPCSVRYEDLMAHLKSDSHQKYANDESNFAKLDELISQCTSLDDFLAEARRHSRASISPEHDIGSPLVKSPLMKEAHISLLKVTSPVPSSIIRQNNHQRKRVGFTPPAPDCIVAKKTKLDL